MREYEIVYIFRTNHTDEEIQARLEEHHTRLTSGEGAEITALEHWGKRPLAYPIERAESGYYVVVRFKADAARLPEFERGLKLDPEILRYLIVLSEGELPAREELGGEEANTGLDKAPAQEKDAEAGGEMAESELSGATATAVADEATAVADEATAVVDEATAVADEATAVVDEATAVVDEAAEAVGDTAEAVGDTDTPEAVED